MNHRFAVLMGGATVAIVIALATPVRADGQALSSAVVKAPGKTWNQPRTPDGQPDLQGVWSNASLVPLERPAAVAGKEFLTEGELAEKEQALKPRARATSGTDAHYDFLTYGLDPLQMKRAPNTRTSLIVDPPDGRIPPVTPEVQKRRAEIRAFQLALLEATDTCKNKMPGCEGGRYTPLSSMLRKNFPNASVSDFEAESQSVTGPGLKNHVNMEPTRLWQSATPASFASVATPSTNSPLSFSSRG